MEYSNVHFSERQPSPFHETDPSHLQHGQVPIECAEEVISHSSSEDGTYRGDCWSCSQDSDQTILYGFAFMDTDDPHSEQDVAGDEVVIYDNDNALYFPNIYDPAVGPNYSTSNWDDIGDMQYFEQQYSPDIRELDDQNIQSNPCFENRDIHSIQDVEYVNNDIQHVQQAHNNGVIYHLTRSDDISRPTIQDFINRQIDDLMQMEERDDDGENSLASDAQDDDSNNSLASDAQDDDDNNSLASDAQDDDDNNSLASDAQDDDDNNSLASDAQDDDGDNSLTSDAQDDDGDNSLASDAQDDDDDNNSLASDAQDDDGDYSLFSGAQDDDDFTLSDNEDDVSDQFSIYESDSKDSGFDEEI